MLLIISQSKKLSKSVRETFHYMSILAYNATPHEALSEISEVYRAILILNPGNFPDINDYVNRLKSYKSDIPIFALSEENNKPFYPDIFDAVFTKNSFTPLLASKIINFANENKRARIGDYRLAGFDASSDLVGVTYFDRKVDLTKTEAMIFRYLLKVYPIPQSAEQIIKYAYKPSRVPEINSIRTHISLMNKKLETALGRKMIIHAPGRGYLIHTPEYDKIISSL